LITLSHYLDFWIVRRLIWLCINGWEFLSPRSCAMLACIFDRLYIKCNQWHLTLLEQNVFNNTILSFDNNNVLKMSIGYANICSNVLDHRQKLSVFNTSKRFWRTNEEQWILQKEACVARERMKKKRIWSTSGVDVIRSWRKEHLKIIRSWSSTESEELKPNFVKRYHYEDIWLQKEWKHGATVISEEI